MNRATPHMRNFAQRLINYEARDKESPGPKTSSGFDVYKKLHPHLASLMGNGGYRALLARALALADVEVGWLQGVHVKTDGSLDVPEGLGADKAEFSEGRVVLLAQLLGLLVAFIGENLTLHLVRDIWPEESLHDVVFETGDKK
jgi:hypothetical protein